MHWNIDPVIAYVDVFGLLPAIGFPPIELRYYGVCFALGLLLCAWRAPYNFDEWRLPREHAERLTLWVPVGMLLGAHYIHLLFYEQEGLFDFPHYDESGHWVWGRFLGLGSGLASHGGGLGCVLAVLLFWYRYGRPLKLRFHHYTDAVMVTSVWVYPFVRLGNFFNSEIVGRPTDSAFGVIFDRYYTEPRHPVVLYEAVMYFAELGFALWAQKNYARKLRPGVFFYGLLMTHFSLRFIAEFFKESQGVDDGWPYHLNMGHALSLPIVLVCAFMIFATKRFSLLAPLTAEEQAERDVVEKDWLARGGPGGSAEPLPEGAAAKNTAKDASPSESDEGDDEAKSEAKPRKKGKKGSKPRRAET